MVAMGLVVAPIKRVLGNTDSFGKLRKTCFMFIFLRSVWQPPYPRLFPPGNLSIGNTVSLCSWFSACCPPASSPPLSLFSITSLSTRLMRPFALVLSDAPWFSACSPPASSPPLFLLDHLPLTLMRPFALVVVCVAAGAAWLRDS